eukprot:Skav230454  [mRNA]  locus=scaffold186:17825:18447:- [translate_table: standard]
MFIPGRERKISSRVESSMTTFTEAEAPVNRFHSLSIISDAEKPGTACAAGGTFEANSFSKFFEMVALTA